MRSMSTLLALPIVVATIAIAIALVRPAPAAAETPLVAASYGPIAARALSDVDQQRGECFPWVRTVVQAATGRTIGGDYHTGYLAAGAIEVPLVSARNGDIIQITNPAITGAFVDYPGLHTAIVLDNYGNGKFRVIDSNKDFDGVVHMRDPYVPAERVARYPGLVVRVYRIEGTAAPSGTTVVPPSTVPPVITTPLPPPVGATGAVPPAGSAATVSADGDCLRVRSIAGLRGSVLGCLPSGARITVTANGPTADGYRWVQVSSGALAGWVAADYLSTSTAAPPVAAPSASTSPAPIVTSAPAPAARPKFVAPPVFAASGHASVVFMGGNIDDLVTAATEVRATGVWAQDGRGEFQLLIINGPSFMTDQFRTRVAGFNGPTAVTLIGS